MPPSSKQSRYLAQRPAAEPQQHVSVRIQTVRQIGRRLTAGKRFFYIAEQRRSRYGIDAHLGADLYRNRSSGQRVDSGRSHITGHLSGKRDQQENPSHERRIERFLPNPPNDIFPTPTATKAPISTIQIGSELGRLNPSNRPVTTAE